MSKTLHDPDRLNVWQGQRLVGSIWRNELGRIGFCYANEWLAAGGFAISQSLPLQVDEFPPDHGLAHRYFANLLPEGGARDRIVRDFKIANSDFSLLRAIGGECAGALSTLPIEQRPTAEHRYDKLSENEMVELVLTRGRVYKRSANDTPRLSLAGAQNKCPVLVENDGCWLPMQGAPSSHILKFELPDYRNIPAYETFTTMLAEAIGLPVVSIRLRSVKGNRYALIARYDRYRDENQQIVRLHQEDFCQALGKGYEHKYQADGGPAFADCYRLLKDVSSVPDDDLGCLLDWQIFNALAGNADAHVKNLSLLYHANGNIRLAPCYDLISTCAIEHIDHHLALFVGDQNNPYVLSRKDWMLLAEQCELRPQFVHDRVLEMTRSLVQALQPTRNRFEGLYGHCDALQRIEHVVKKQCRRMFREYNIHEQPRISVGPELS